MGISAMFMATMAGLGVQRKQASDMKQKAKDQATEQKMEQQKLLSEAKEKERQEQAQAETLEQNRKARSLLKQNQLQAAGKQGSILTGPLGAPFGVDEKPKTILGA